MSAFPPSSPLLEHTEREADDPFSSFSGPSAAPKKLVINTPFSKNAVKQSTQAYPTPNPSSSAGRSSSPARQQAELPLPRSESNASADEPQAQTAATVDALAPALIPTKPLSVLLYPGEKVSIGRSSRCGYFIKCRYASREHLKLHYDLESNELTVLCKGYNGASIHFGSTHYGEVIEGPDKVFTFVEKTKDDLDEDVHAVEKFELCKDEQMTVPYNDKMTLEIKGTVISVAITNVESETEDEMPVLTKSLSSIEPTEQMKKNSVPETAEVKKQVEAEPTTSSTATAPTAIKVPELKPSSSENITLQTPLNKPIKPLELAPAKHLSRSSTPVLKSSVAIETPTLEFKTEADRAKSVEPEFTIKSTLSQHHIHQRSKSTEVKADDVLRTPLQPKTQNEINKQHQSRRRKAESGNSPQKKKLDTKPQLHAVQPQEPRLKIESMNLKEILATVDDFDTVQNLLTNHLAFSRLSQTPLRQLQTISASTQALTRQQLRAILASTEWIGVIYRKGKDAAGKHLDEEYYYDVEHDQDASRVQLVSSIKGSSGLRNCRKTHKQYFWKKPVSRK